MPQLVQILGTPWRFFLTCVNIKGIKVNVKYEQDYKHIPKHPIIMYALLVLNRLSVVVRDEKNIFKILFVCATF